MFSTIRTLFFIVAFILGCTVFFIKKSGNESVTLRKIILIIFLYIIVVTISNLIPIENAFITFSTPEEAYNYFDSADVEIVVKGEESALVIATDNKYAIVPKSSNGWKIGMGLDSKTINQKIYNGFWIFVLKYKNTDEYYIVVSSMDEKITDITDSMDSVFYNSDNSMFSYAYVKEYNNDYYVNVNGESISMVIEE